MLEQYHKSLYDTNNDQIDPQVTICLEMIDTQEDKAACIYDDGDFDGSQWDDIQTIQYGDAILDITSACLIHGADDSQSLYRPYMPATNAAAVKI